MCDLIFSRKDNSPQVSLSFKKHLFTVISTHQI